MRLEIEKRVERSSVMQVVSPVLAVALTLLSTAIVFAILGKNPLSALGIYFLEPLTQAWSLQELLVKATPLCLIAVGLSLCYLSNNWNIGAEGQFVFGATTGGAAALSLQGAQTGLALPLILACGAAGGALFALIPAVLKVRFNANEILTSLLLVYVAELLLDYLVRGPWRDPSGFNFPQTVSFDHAMPILLAGSRVHLGTLFALVALVAGALFIGRSLVGFEIRVLGQAPRAALFAGFSPPRMTILVFLVSGALAGLAGISEVVGSIGQLQPSVSPGYGFSAIIVAFLGRLNPLGIGIGGLLLALSYLGGEAAQVTLKMPVDVTRVIQGMLLLYVLACDALILYRPRLVRAAQRA
jgi:simple sugar transport system permease protein